MAIDHVRVYSGQPAGGPTPGIFFTRWITHFVAPAFVFLAGTGAFLHGTRLGAKAPLAKFLLTRGAWLVLLELTVLRVGWTFNVDFAHYELAGVIWMIGWCMILMAPLIYLPLRALGTLGVAIILAHNVFDFFAPTLGPLLFVSGSAWLWRILYLGGAVNLGGGDGPPLLVLFSIIPWIGVMAAGYAFGPVMRTTAERRRTLCFRLGCAAILGFVALRALDVYGDPRPWRHPPRNAQRAQPRPTQVAPRPPRHRLRRRRRHHRWRRSDACPSSITCCTSRSSIWRRSSFRSCGPAR
ncbi:MAG: heparan-alpha-glucosaminide N-acetyltransferase domain-containing protein [Gemmatimonadota bacterium]|nr:heparan-alpha-glucosaminide N-acetyltransferase domain-containing protein [Gemmatimonadota bacterium]